MREGERRGERRRERRKREGGRNTSINLNHKKGVECLLHALMCSVSVVFIHTMEDDQRLNTLVHEGDTLHLSLQHCKKTVNQCKFPIRTNL